MYSDVHSQLGKVTNILREHNHVRNPFLSQYQPFLLGTKHIGSIICGKESLFRRLPASQGLLIPLLVPALVKTPLLYIKNPPPSWQYTQILHHIGRRVKSKNYSHGTSPYTSAHHRSHSYNYTRLVFTAGFINSLLFNGIFNVLCRILSALEHTKDSFSTLVYR